MSLSSIHNHNNTTGDIANSPAIQKSSSFPWGEVLLISNVMHRSCANDEASPIGGRPANNSRLSSVKEYLGKKVQSVMNVFTVVKERIKGGSIGHNLKDCSYGLKGENKTGLGEEAYKLPTRKVILQRRAERRQADKIIQGALNRGAATSVKTEAQSPVKNADRERALRIRELKNKYKKNINEHREQRMTTGLINLRKVNANNSILRELAGSPSYAYRQPDFIGTPSERATAIESPLADFLK